MSQRKEYIEKLEAQIQDAQTALDRLKAERDEAVQDLQHQEIDRLEHHLANARVNLTAISEAAEEAWTDLKDVIDKLLRELRDSLNTLLKK